MSAKEIVIATRNDKKAQEIVSILKDINIKVLTLNEFPGCPDVVEDGDTFEANAIKKAITVANYTGRLTLADDSGLEVYALNNEPGVYSARYSGLHSTDEANNIKLLYNLKDFKDGDRKARFVCVIALADTKEVKKIFTGIVEGSIACSTRGNSGFGYDPLFIPNGFDKTFGELDPNLKNKISHRGRALEELKRYFASSWDY